MDVVKIKVTSIKTSTYLNTRQYRENYLVNLICGTHAVLVDGLDDGLDTLGGSNIPLQRINIHTNYAQQLTICSQQSGHLMAF
jgi:hypothetical protein